MEEDDCGFEFLALQRLGDEVEVGVVHHAGVDFGDEVGGVGFFEVMPELGDVAD